jgi:uncharacterized protein (DUF952 family)
MAHPWLLYHLVPREIWDGAPDPYVPGGYAEVGFVHLSTSDQVDIPGRALFAGRDDMALLVIDSRRLADEVRLEEGDPPTAGVLFPHLYGPLPHAAVIDVLPYRAPT